MNTNTIRKLLNSSDPIDISQSKVFEYPFLFNIEPDGNSDVSFVDLDTIDSDCVFESLNPISRDVFRNTFLWMKHNSTDTLEEYTSKNYETTYFAKDNIVETNIDISHNENTEPSLDTYEWDFDLSNVEKLMTEFEKVFRGHMVPVGRTFTDKGLYYGVLGNYFIQYLANGIFGHPNAIVCIHNQREIIESFEKLHLHIYQQLSDKAQFNIFAERLRMIFTESEPGRWINSNTSGFNKFPFNKGDILEFYVRIKGEIHPPVSEIPSHNIHIQKTWIDLIEHSSICDVDGKLANQIWKVRFILI